MIERLNVYLEEEHTRPTEVVLASDYDALAARLAEAERMLRSIAANTCCGDCQEAKRVAQAYFGPADSATPREDAGQ